MLGIKFRFSYSFVLTSFLLSSCLFSQKKITIKTGVYGTTIGFGPTDGIENRSNAIVLIFSSSTFKREFSDQTKKYANFNKKDLLQKKVNVIHSDKNGFYELSLKEGNYSICPGSAQYGMGTKDNPVIRIIPGGCSSFNLKSNEVKEFKISFTRRVRATLIKKE